MEIDNAEQEELEKVVSFTPITPGKCVPARTEFSNVLLASSSGEEVEMELGNAMQEKLQKTLSWAPITPDKCPARTEFNSIDAGLNKFLSISSSDNSQKKDEEVSALVGRKSEFLSRNLDGDSKSAWLAPSTPIKKGNPREKQSGSLDLNDRPHKKPRMRKHTPKIFDESKPKKTPKPKVKPSPPKPGNSKASARTKKKLEKACEKVSDDLSGHADMQAPNSKIPGTIPESLVLQVSTPQPETLEHAIPATSPPELEHDILTNLGHDLKSCRRVIDFNLENENDVISVGATEVIWDHVTHSYNKFLTNPLDGVNEQAVDTNISIGLEDNLEAESTFQPNQAENGASIYQDDQSACQHHFLKVYKRRNKTKTELMPLAGNEADIYPNDRETTGQTGCRDRFLKVYKRRTKGNIGVVSLAGNEADDCSRNNRNLKPEATIICKKRRTKRRKALVFLKFLNVDADKGWSTLKTHMNFKVTASANKMGRRRGAKRATEKRIKIGKRDNCFTISKRVTRRNFGIANDAKKTCFSTMNSGQKGKLKSLFVGEVLPNKNQITVAMANPEFFECVFSLSPIVKSRRKRSIRPKRTKSACREENTDLEPLSLALTLSPLVTSKIKRSKNSKRSTAILDSLCLKSEISPINEIESFLDKLACNEILECSQHEDMCSQTDKSAFNKIQECPQQQDPWPRTESSADLESLVASLIQRLENIRICDKKTYKRKAATSKKRTSKNVGRLVPWNPFGPINIYKGKDKPSTQKPPRVDLDMESLRVWKLLIENEGEIDEDLDKEKEIWWEEQREIFQGRAASFIARMRLVLGDRRFSEWKGSVVDSVVGVYLTQNVSDNLSSNAFMLLASAFPPQNKQEMTIPQGQALMITEGMPDSFEREVSADEKDPELAGFSCSQMSTCRSSIDELSSVNDRNTSECLPTSYTHLHHVGDCKNERLHETQVEENLSAESTCGSQATVTSCSSEVINSAKSDDLGNEAVNLPEKISREKDELPKKEIDWDELRKTYSTGRSSGLTERNRDSVDWEAIRHADVEKIVEPIKSRGQGNVLAAKIKNFLNRLVEDHGSIDLEWLRDVPTDKAKEYLLSIVGLGPKSVDCLRLLTLRHCAFPVDINVARVSVRLGWVPLQPLPDGILMHLLEKYPLESSIQKYLWPRLCNLDLLILYELHYHMITFGKVFCTKKNPNCNACPLRAECRHFASAFASARLRLPGPQQKGVVAVKQPVRVDEVPNMCVPSPNLSLSGESFLESRFQTQECEPIIEMPESPEHRPIESLERDIEDFPCGVEHEQEIPTIQLNTNDFRENILNLINKSNAKEFQENVLNFVNEISTLHRDEEVSKALVLLDPESASRHARKLKSESRTRTEHTVYELPDYHPLLSGFEKREPDDPCPYLLAICQTEEEIKNQKKFGRDSSSKELELYGAKICSGSTSYSQNDQIVYGTILIPCRTANRGSFPLNGTYFQVNEVFADHESSECPIRVPRVSIWHLRRKTLYCGTTVHAIAKGMSTEDIQYCFWRGYTCVRGYDRKQRAPRPLPRLFHSGYKSKIGNSDDQHLEGEKIA
ncbi:uncharacterized protein LOC132633540 isoform X2 [Lycium barbarum]|uniref:uncharacterized protein LOC132633540 isoform X2 n=1 Tax=Lycium barbarum TaxID=112863 RepID=UPI00293ED4C0|nr:uncharacterized protein LOC132633540 isoform X2 [Lycium barbarum]XP_060206007.1 uncharacterized protein LOC132633540 isoform X2 [Lycium barbarum]XP_060206008.1 uncharacterized protein LOC132633540 isoform X2 [Lycium barbarum]